MVHGKHNINFFALNTSMYQLGKGGPKSRRKNFRTTTNLQFVTRQESKRVFLALENS